MVKEATDVVSPYVRYGLQAASDVAAPALKAAEPVLQARAAARCLLASSLSRCVRPGLRRPAAGAAARPDLRPSWLHTRVPPSGRRALPANRRRSRSVRLGAGVQCLDTAFPSRCASELRSARLRARVSPFFHLVRL